MNLRSVEANKPRSVVVIGGGLSGLVIGYRLKQQGCNVTVVEAGRRVGGMMQTIRHEEGFVCEAGPNGFESTPEIADLVREVGLSRELVTAEAGLPWHICLRRRLHPIPEGPGGLLATPLLGPAAKLRALREYWAPPEPSGREESVAQFVNRRFGPQVLRNIVAPLVSWSCAGDPEHLSIRHVLPRLRRYELEHGSVLRGFRRSRGELPIAPGRLCSFQDGVQALPRRLAELIGRDHVVLGMRPRKIVAVPREGERTYRLRVGTQEEERDVSCDALVLAIPAYRAAEILEPLSEPIASELSGIEYPPLVVLSLGYRKSDVAHSLRGCGFLVPKGEGLSILGCLWSSSLFPARAPEESVLLTAWTGGATHADVDGLSDDAILAAVRHDLRVALGIIIVPDVPAMHRYERSVPQYTLGHGRRLRSIADKVAKIPGLFLAGNYLTGISVGDCVRQANATAARVARYLA